MSDQKALDKLIDELAAGLESRTAIPLAEPARAIADLSAIMPDEIKRRRQKAVFLDQAAAMVGREAPAQPVPGRLISWFGVRRIAAGALVLAMFSGSTVYAAENALPGDLLYPVKRAAEKSRLALTPSGGKAAYALVLAKERVKEAKKLLTSRKQESGSIDGLLTESLSSAAVARKHNTGRLNSELAVEIDKVKRQAGGLRLKHTGPPVMEDGRKGKAKEKPPASGFRSPKPSKPKSR